MLYTDIGNQTLVQEFNADTGVYCFSVVMNSGTMCIDLQEKLVQLLAALLLLVHNII
jgi:hypothetical protein